MTVGKKKKKRVIVYRTKKKSMLPLFVVAGGVALWFMFGNKAQAAPPVIVDDGSSGGGTLVDDGSGTGTQVIQPPPIVVAPGANLPALDTVATSDRAALIRDLASYPAIVAALKLMTSPEVVAMYNYTYNYFLPGKKLYRLPDPSAPGQWDTALYDKIQAIKSKYGILI